MTPRGSPKRPPISSPVEARSFIAEWLETVRAYGFPEIEHKSRTQRMLAVENRRRTFVAVGEIAQERGFITVALSVRDVAERAGLPRSTVHAHLVAEAKLKKLLRVQEGGRAGVGSKWATVYKLHVDDLERLRSSDGNPDRSSDDSPDIRQLVQRPTDAVHQEIDTKDADLEGSAPSNQSPAQANPSKAGDASTSQAILPQAGPAWCPGCQGQPIHSGLPLCDFHWSEL